MTTLAHDENEVCVKCGVTGFVFHDSKHSHCLDCGSAWARVKVDNKPKAKKSSNKG